MNAVTPIRMVIAVVGLTLILALAGILALAITSNPVPDVLQNIAVGAMTGLVGLLVPAGSKTD